MELISHNPGIDFIKYRRFWVTVSTIVNLAVITGWLVFGLNYGVDFAGGSEIEIKFDKPIDAEVVRKRLTSAGIPDVNVQVFGDPSEHDFLLHTPRISLLNATDATKLDQTLRGKFAGTVKAGLDGFAFDPEKGDELTLGFTKLPAENIEKAKAAIKEAVEAAGAPVMSVNQPTVDSTGAATFPVVLSGISNKVQTALADHPEKAELQRVEYVGAAVGKQLRNRGLLSVIVAMAFILGYVALRFDMRFAPGAVIALIHDAIVVLGYFVLSRREFNLTSVAVLLTVVGYSVSDTIVIYDRIRETLSRFKGQDLITLINKSINETLSRTVITSFATALSLSGLLIFTVGSIWDFAMAMLVGIITGTYSSIYIASPVTIWLEELQGKHKPPMSGSGVGKAA
jgi:preprotein translocase subunit SecF